MHAVIHNTNGIESTDSRFASVITSNLGLKLNIEVSFTCVTEPRKDVASVNCEKWRYVRPASTYMGPKVW